MFKIKQSDSYRWPVKFGIPIDGGKIDPQTFDIEFKRLPTSKITAIMGDAGEGKLKAADVCREVVVGWAEVFDDNKEPVPFSAMALDALIEVPGFAPAVTDALIASVTGLRSKN